MKAREVLGHLADNLSRSGWSWGCVSTVDAQGRTIFNADSHRGDGQRFVVHADEKLTAFLELERAMPFPVCPFWHVLRLTAPLVSSIRWAQSRI
jgi:hypothetical protein